MTSKEQLKEELNEDLLEFFNSPKEEIIFDQLSYAILREVLNELDFEQDPDGDFETNGWQYDYWVDYINEEGKILGISGSFYYGEIVIMKKEKSVDE